MNTFVLSPIALQTTLLRRNCWMPTAMGAPWSIEAELLELPI